MKVTEIFKSIQGEGRYAGYPVLFIRLSGCTRKCDFCDSSYHTTGKEMSVEEITKIINNTYLNIVVWTGGEPLMQINEIESVILNTRNKSHHLETNGDLVKYLPNECFSYVCFSPKDVETTKDVKNFIKTFRCNYDIKIVTDLVTNEKLIPYATMLMPLTIRDDRINKIVEQKIWNYCVSRNVKFCLRQHIKVWDLEKRQV